MVNDLFIFEIILILRPRYTQQYCRTIILNLVTTKKLTSIFYCLNIVQEANKVKSVWINSSTDQYSNNRNKRKLLFSQIVPFRYHAFAIVVLYLNCCLYLRQTIFKNSIIGLNIVVCNGAFIKKTKNKMRFLKLRLH